METAAPLTIVGLKSGYHQGDSVLSKRLYVVVDEFSFAFQPGVHGILGRNGAGKSTLLVAFLDPNRRLAGQVLSRGEPVLTGEVAYVPQNPSLTLSPWLTVEEESTLALRIRGVSKSSARQEVESRLRELGLDLPLDRRVSALSGGQKVAVAILRAACVPEPKAFILDEPTEGLDVDSREVVLSLIRRIGDARKVPVIMTSHRVEDLTAIGARLYMLLGTPVSGLEECSPPPSVPSPGTLVGAVNSARPGSTADVVSRIEGQKRSDGWRSARASLIRSGIGILLGAFIWLLMSMLVANPGLLPSPISVAREIGTLLSSPDESKDLLSTLMRILAAWFVGNAVAVPVGILLGYDRRAFQVISPWLLLARSVPIFALLGVAAGMFPRMPEIQRMFLVTLMVAALTVQTVAAAGSIGPRQRIWLAKVYGAGNWFCLTRIMPFETRSATYAGIEVSFPLAVVVVYVIELFLIPHIGLGKHLYNHFNDRDLSRLFACILIPGLLGIVVISSVRWLASRGRFDV